MRLSTVIASIFTTAALSVSAQTSGSSNDAGSSELLAELAQLPECAVSSLLLAILRCLTYLCREESAS